VIVLSELEQLRLSAVLGVLRLRRRMRSAAALVVAALRDFFTVTFILAMVLNVSAAESMFIAASPSLHADVMFPPGGQEAPPSVAMLLPRAASRPADLPWEGGPDAGA
jgi:hypothetical protein